MPRILLVDDDSATLDALPPAIRLRLPDVAMDVCDSAALAVQRIKEIDYDAIVTDIKMPGVDGLALLSMIQRLRPKTPTLLITGHGERDLAVQALRGGAYDFIQKPIDRDYMAASLKRALQVTELQRELDAHQTSVERRAEELEQAVHERTRELLQANHEQDRLLADRAGALANARAAQHRLAFLVEASQVLSSLDYDTTLENIARLSVPTLAENCVVTVIAGEDDQYHRAVASSEPEHEEELAQLLSREPSLGAWTLDTVAQLEPSGGSVILDPSSLAEGFRTSPEQLAYLRALGQRAVMLVPLTAQGRTLGALAFGMGTSHRTYGDDDRALAEDLARRCAMAVDNARLYMESEAASERLRRANEAKDEFLALISHEMRTPLTTVCGTTQMLVRRGDQMPPEVRSEMLASLAQEAQRLRRIVEDLLVLARVEMKAPLMLAPVDLRTVLRSVSDGFRQIQPERKVEIVTPPDLPPVAAEPTYVEQLLHNLLSNADKYSASGTPVEVRVEAPQGDATCVSVLDRGIGIEPHEVDLIFERFYRSERTEAPGVGMGLTVCRRLVEALGGQIWAAPREGGGLSVSFTLPVWRAEPAQQGGDAAASAAMSEAPKRVAAQ